MTSNVITDEQRAVFFILQLAEQGRFDETIAQMIASAILASDGGGDEMYQLRSRITTRMLDLIMDPSEIWDGLLPGGPGPHNSDLLTVITMDEYGKLDQARRNVEEIVDIVGGAPDKGVHIIVDELDLYFRKEGLVTPHVTMAHEPNGIDKYEYQISIIVNPFVKHGRKTDVIEVAEDWEGESPLNAARYVIDAMERIDNLPSGHAKQWPCEELAARIYHRGSDQTFIMTYDQAIGIVALEEASERLATLQFDDSFQAIAEEMGEAGLLYAAQWTANG
jgi:hypothetical protein